MATKQWKWAVIDRRQVTTNACRSFIGYFFTTPRNLVPDHAWCTAQLKRYKRATVFIMIDCIWVHGHLDAQCCFFLGDRISKSGQDFCNFFQHICCVAAFVTKTKRRAGQQVATAIVFLSWRLIPADAMLYNGVTRVIYGYNQFFNDDTFTINTTVYYVLKLSLICHL